MAKEPWDLTEIEAVNEGKKLKPRFDEADRLFSTLVTKRHRQKAKIRKSGDTKQRTTQSAKRE